MMKLILGLTLSLLSAIILAEQVAKVTVDQAWGLLIGDEITVQVELPEVASTLDVSSLPEDDSRYGTWLFLKKRSIKDRTLLFAYQIVNVPVENTVVYTPEFNLRLLNDEWVTVPAMPLTIGSLLPVEDGDNAPKADHLPISIATTNIDKRLILFSIMATVTSLILFIWHVGWRPTQRKPFAQAIYDIKYIRWLVATRPISPARELHRAFNRTANTVVVQADLDVLFKQAPWLQPLKQEITAFYHASASHFFMQSPEQEQDKDSILKLAKACRAKEKLT